LPCSSAGRRERPPYNSQDAAHSDEFRTPGELSNLIALSQRSSFSDNLVLYSSTSPAGPFGGRTHVYSTPETQVGLFTYDAHVHPEFTDASGLLVSYDVNTFDPERVALERRQLPAEIHQGQDRALRLDGNYTVSAGGVTGMC